MFNEKKRRRAEYSTPAQREAKIGMRQDKCQAIAQIQGNSSGSFYDRYKKLLKAMDIQHPDRMKELSDLNKLRDAFVHFRTCDVLIVEDSHGAFCRAQTPPDVFAQLKAYKVYGWPVIAADVEEDYGEWTLRVSTNAMAAWSLSLALEAILHVLYLLPAGEYRDVILRRYRARDAAFSTVFEWGKSRVEEWKNSLFLAS